MKVMQSIIFSAIVLGFVNNVFAAETGRVSTLISLFENLAKNEKDPATAIGEDIPFSSIIELRKKIMPTHMYNILIGQDYRLLKSQPSGEYKSLPDKRVNMDLHLTGAEIAQILDSIERVGLSILSISRIK